MMQTIIEGDIMVYIFFLAIIIGVVLYSINVHMKNNRREDKHQSSLYSEEYSEEDDFFNKDKKDE